MDLERELMDVAEETPDADQQSSIPLYKLNGKSIEEFTKEGLGLIVDATKHTNVIPSGASRNLYSAYPAFNQTIENQSQQILETISKVIKLQHIKGNIQRRDNDEKMELMLECNDIMLERINSNLDILAGVRQNNETVLIETEINASPVTHKPSSGSWNENRKIATAARGRTAKLLTARNIVRPQISFKTPVDNSALAPFTPRIQDKPHSLKPLAILPEYNDDGNIESYLHPYEFELSKFAPPESQIVKVKPCKPLNLNETPYLYVDTENALNTLMQELSVASEIAVDVEHHSYRTFQGITCLLQLSTRKKDYVIDTLALRDELHILNQIFTDPKIVKVFHGADSDVEWLQRDLSVYIVNMFDTHQAAKRLGFARLSLAFLLKHYCQIDADKSLQLADWRMRPLPNELILYARQDTHYLLYIYDLLRNELLTTANDKTYLLLNVYQSSTEVCGKRYIKLKITPESHMELFRKSKRIFDNRQLFALKELFLWRDSIARLEDESYSYVLPNHMMLQIAENLPREMQGILACCNPIPPLVRQHLHVLHKFILKAREQPLVKIVLEEQIANRSTILSKYQDLNSHLYCPHDLSVNTEYRDDLPTLLGNESNQIELNHFDAVDAQKKLKVPAIRVFHSSNRINDKRKMQTVYKIKFVSPYSRYLAVLPFVEKQRQEELAKAAEENRKRKLCPEKHVTIAADVLIIPKNENDTLRNDEDRQIALKDYAKPKTSGAATISFDESNRSKQTDVEETQTEKKRRIDIGAIESKLSEIRQSVDTMLTVKGVNDNRSSANNKKQQKQSKTEKAKNKYGKLDPTNSTGDSQQSSSKSVEFDYTKVDFKKFQGGSLKPQANTEFKSKFHGKGKNNKANKQFNKLFSFSKVNKK